MGTFVGGPPKGMIHGLLVGVMEVSFSCDCRDEDIKPSLKLLLALRK
jgi:hypothetical protein